MLTFSRVQIPPTILIADDDEGLLILIENSLRREGYEVARPSSGFPLIRLIFSCST